MNVLMNILCITSYFTTGVLDDGSVPFVVQIIQQSQKRKTDNFSIRCDVYKVSEQSLHVVWIKTFLPIRKKYMLAKILVLQINNLC